MEVLNRRTVRADLSDMGLFTRKPDAPAKPRLAVTMLAAVLLLGMSCGGDRKPSQSEIDAAVAKALATTTTTVPETTTTTAAPETTTTTAAPTTTTTALPPTTTTTLLLTHKITGTFKLFSADGGVIATGGQCLGARGYDDIGVGTGVIIRDGSGATLASTKLATSTGKTVNELMPGKYPELANRVVQCNYTWSAPQVADADFYEIEVGHRGGITLSKEELKAAGWKVSTSLGPAL
jgi:hypothetical protein